MPDLSLPVEKIVFFYAMANAFLWFAAALWTFFCLRKQPHLPLNGSVSPSKTPSVSVILPGRNEAQRVLRECVESLLRQTYPNFELIAVNDRSTDETEKILREVKGAFPQSDFQVLQGSEPPEGWLGKPFAMQTALAKAKGEMILTTDADMIFAPEALSTAIAHLQRTDCDALTLIPFNENLSFWEKAFMPVFEWFRMLAMPFYRVNNPQRRESLGSGNFFLFKREVLESLNGFAEVAGDIAEDLTLAQNVKDKGFRLRVEYAPTLFRTRMYRNLHEIWHGFTKNFFAAMKNSKTSAIGGVLSIIFFSVVPNLLLILLTSSLLISPNEFRAVISFPLLIVYLLQLATFWQMSKYLGASLQSVLVAPLGIVLFGAILANSFYRVTTKKGVQWKSRAILKG